ncbi:uncharacterized protein LOC144007408 isoform X3 [Festucalex cinctus]
MWRFASPSFACVNSSRPRLQSNYIEDKIFQECGGQAETTSPGQTSHGKVGERWMLFTSWRHKMADCGSGRFSSNLQPPHPAPRRLLLQSRSVLPCP